MSFIEPKSELDEKILIQEREEGRSKSKQLLEAVRKRKVTTALGLMMLVAPTMVLAGCGTETAQTSNQLSQQQTNERNTYKTGMNARKSFVKSEEKRIENAIELENDKQKKAILQERLKELTAEEQLLSDELNEYDNNSRYVGGGSYIYSGGYRGSTSSKSGIAPKSSYSSGAFSGKVGVYAGKVGGFAS